MTLLLTFSALCAVAAFTTVVTACGIFLLRQAKLPAEDALERLLLGTGLGSILFLLVTAVAESLSYGRCGIWVAITVVSLAGIRGVRETVTLARIEFEALRGGATAEKLLCLVAAGVVLFEGICALAPLTGSDALHYHFAAPAATLQSGFRPDFFLAHGFFTGLGHLFIYAGLALGSEQFSLGLLFLGGALSAAAVFCLTRKFCSGSWPSIAALAFLLTPVVFWQMTSAGAPDLWMAFFAALGVLLIAGMNLERSAHLALLSGAFAGAAAGVKYTGLFFATALFLALLYQTRSAKRIGQFFGCALLAGIWPYARNWKWTGDPLFPFGGPLFHRISENPFCLASMRADTGAYGGHRLSSLLPMPFFAAADPAHLGFWQFFGPLCLTFAPLVCIFRRKNSLWVVALLVCVLSTILVAVFSGMARFLLPVFPLGLFLALEAASQLETTNWWTAKFAARISVASVILLGGGGLLLYSKASFAAALGIIPREKYLEQRAPDFEKSAFVNSVLVGTNSGRTMVFFRHTYYLQVPYLNGNPDISWAVDPAKLDSAARWRNFLHENDIQWIVRSGDYPPSISAPLRELELAGALRIVKSGIVNDFSGNRSRGTRTDQDVVIFRVAE